MSCIKFLREAGLFLSFSSLSDCTVQNTEEVRGAWREHLTSKQSNVGVFGVIRASRHSIDWVSYHLQSVALKNHAHKHKQAGKNRFQSSHSKQYKCIHGSMVKTSHKRMAIRQCYGERKLMTQWWQLGNKRVTFSYINKRPTHTYRHPHEV